MLADELLQSDRPGLLVSVRSVREAHAALEGGADVIDVKEPSRGPLGAADWQTIADIAQAVSRRAPLTAAAGELVELTPKIAASSQPAMPNDVQLAKIGLARSGTSRQWRAQWSHAIAALQTGVLPEHALPVAVIYADWQAAGAPPPQEIYSAAMDIGCRVVLIDTWEKRGVPLFAHWHRDDLRLFIDRLRSNRIAVVLAGSLSEANLLTATKLRPTLVAVRGAACHGGRSGDVVAERIARLRSLMAEISQPPLRQIAR